MNNELKIKLIVSIIFLAGSIITYMNKTEEDLDIFKDIIESSILIKTKIPLKKGTYLMTKGKSSKTNCILHPEKIQIIELLGFKFFKLNAEIDYNLAKDLFSKNGKSTAKFQRFEDTANFDLCGSDHIIYTY
jgi:hypothetical protein